MQIGDEHFVGLYRRPAARPAHRAGLNQALAAVWPGSILTVTKFDRFARDIADAHAILTDLSDRGTGEGSAGHGERAAARR